MPRNEHFLPRNNGIIQSLFRKNFSERNSVPNPISRESWTFPLYISFFNPCLKIFLIHLLNGPVYPPYHSVHDRTLPDPRNRGRSRDVYAEVLSMMIKNLTKPSAVLCIPGRGSSRDNSRNRFRKIPVTNMSANHVETVLGTDLVTIQLLVHLLGSVQRKRQYP
jgi:hypothetical protein